MASGVGDEILEEGDEVGREDWEVDWYGGRLLDANECRMSSMAEAAEAAGPEPEVIVGEEAEETDDAPEGRELVDC